MRRPIHELTAGLADTCGIEQASVRRLTELWLDSLAAGAIDRWQRRMGVGEREPVAGAAIVAPGNLFVATWTAMLEPWLCGADVRIRPGSGDPNGPSNLIAALGGDGLTTHIIARGDGNGWRAFLRDAQALAVYGGDEAVAAVRAIATDVGYVGEFRGHGHKLSIATLKGDEINVLASDWAHDALLADGRGCMSLRGVRVTGPFGLNEAGRKTFARVAERLPAGVLPTAALAARRLLVEQARLDAALGAPVQVHEFGDAAVIEDRRPLPELEMHHVGPGARLVVIRPWAPLSPQLHAHLAIDAKAQQVGKMQAPAPWRDPDGYPVGEAFMRDAGSP